MAIDVTGGSIDLTVFGGPTVLDVAVDFGQTGARGSRIWAGFGDPNLYTFDQEVRLYDWYINIDSNSNKYGVMYQYTATPGSLNWVEALRIGSPEHSEIHQTTFTDGGNGLNPINIPVSSLTTDTSVLPSNFSIRYSIVGNTPISSAFEYDIVEVSGVPNIQIVMTGIEYNSTTSAWDNLAGVKHVHLHITYTG